MTRADWITAVVRTFVASPLDRHLFIEANRRFLESLEIEEKRKIWLAMKEAA